MGIDLIFHGVFSVIGEGAGAGAADKRATTGQPAAVHSADWYQGHRAACSTNRRKQHWHVYTHSHTDMCIGTHVHNNRDLSHKHHLVKRLKQLL